jgi:CO/xanthine dehydrogenase FAD-binding subunit
VIPFPFTYLLPDTLQEAADAYSDFESRGLSPLYLSGGTEIITMGRVNSIHFDAVIDLKSIAQMRGFCSTNGSFFLGAAESLNDVSCWNGFPLLSECCQRIADHTAQCKITLGGNIAGTVIYHEAALALMLAKAKVELYGPEGGRTAELNSLFIPPLAIKRGEMIVRFSFETQYAVLPFVHVKHVASEKIGYPLFTLAVIIRDGVMDAAVSGLFRYPFCFHFPLHIGDSSPESISKQLHSQIIEPPVSDVAGSADYRLFRLESALKDAMIKLGGLVA